MHPVVGFILKEVVATAVLYAVTQAFSESPKRRKRKTRQARQKGGSIMKSSEMESKKYYLVLSQGGAYAEIFRKEGCIGISYSVRKDINGIIEKSSNRRTI